MSSTALIDAQLQAIYTSVSYIMLLPILLLGALISYYIISAIRENERQIKLQTKQRDPYGDPYSPGRQKVFRISEEELKAIFDD